MDSYNGIKVLTKGKKGEQYISVTFNTGRGYTQDGQVIAAIVHQSDSGRNLGIVFADFVRGITGYIPWFGRFTLVGDLTDAVMYSYDYGNYTHDHTGMSGLLTNPQEQTA